MLFISLEVNKLSWSSRSEKDDWLELSQPAKLAISIVGSPRIAFCFLISFLSYNICTFVSGSMLVRPAIANRLHISICLILLKAPFPLFYRT